MRRNNSSLEILQPAIQSPYFICTSFRSTFPFSSIIKEYASFISLCPLLVNTNSFLPLVRTCTLPYAVRLKADISRHYEIHTIALCENSKKVFYRFFWLLVYFYKVGNNVVGCHNSYLEVDRFLKAGGCFIQADSN